MLVQWYRKGGLEGLISTHPPPNIKKLVEESAMSKKVKSTVKSTELDSY